MKRTHQPKKRQRVKVHGFRARMSTPGGVKVIKARRRKGRRRLTPTSSRRASSEYFTLFVSDNGLGRPRVGLAVSRKLGNAVVRNRIKRRLRELVRPLLTRTGDGRDVVI